MKEKDRQDYGHSHHRYDIDNNTISEIEAVERTTAWRAFVQKNVPGEDDVAMIPRAVYISMEDIKELYEKHKDHAVGARAYFTFKEQPVIDAPEPSVKPEISVILVPVNIKDEDMLSSDLSLPAGRSYIYDFTKPCPDLCDVNSPLYAAPANR
jgi:hypothetical protein